MGFLEGQFVPLVCNSHSDSPLASSMDTDSGNLFLGASFTPRARFRDFVLCV